jgi:hypothetical protein
MPVPIMPWRHPLTASKGTLWGCVTDAVTGLPIDDATVQVDSMSAVKTDGNGYYVVTMIPAATFGIDYTVSASKSGYPTNIHDSVQVVAGEIRRDDFVLGASPPPPPAITLHPQFQTVPGGCTAVFSAAATGEGTLIYQWQKDGADLTDGDYYAGSTTTTLMIPNVDSHGAGGYRCAVTNAGGTTFSDEAALTVTAPGDLDRDEDVDGMDFLTFSICFNGSLHPPNPACEDSCADLDRDGDVDGEDFLTFSLCFNGSNRPPTCL